MKRRRKRAFRRSGLFYVYLLECRDGTYYTGFTPDIKKRLKAHNSGKGAKYTRDRRPVKLVWKKAYTYFKNAFLEEKRIKKLPRELKKLLIRQGSKRGRNKRRLGSTRKHGSSA